MARKSTARKGQSKRRKPSNAKPRRVRHGSGKPTAAERKRVIAAAQDTRGFMRQPTWGQFSYLNALLGCVGSGTFSGYAAPQNHAEANVQIRTLAGAKATAQNATVAKEIEKVLAGKAEVRPPVSDSDSLTYLAAQRAVKE